MHIFAATLAATLITTTHAATVPPDYGYQWATIGDAGNRHTNDQEAPGVFGLGGIHVGGVDYEYRMATTEVTVGQHLEFVQAYMPIYFANTGDNFGRTSFTGLSIRATPEIAHIRGDISARAPTNMSWEYAARFVNWLHNGKVNEEWAFETGVYDTSTFTQNPDGTWNHQATHNPDADFWIPTSDEWVKAAYWDPEKNNGEGGYWRFQNSSNIEPLPFVERNNALFAEPLMDVGSFPDVQSPWGILDMAGGQWEYTETIAGSFPRDRLTGGSNFRQTTYGDIFSMDIIGSLILTSTTSSSGGFRLASRVPSPGVSLSFLTLCLLTQRRRPTH